MFRCRPLARIAFLVVGAVAACSDDPSDTTPSEQTDGGTPNPDGGTPGVDGGVDASPDAPVSPPKLTITASVSPVATNACTELSLEMVDGAGTVSGFPQGADVAMTSDPLTKIFATDADCRSDTPTTNVAIAAGATGKPFFLRTTAKTAVTVTATAPFGTATLTFTPNELLVLGQPDAQTVRQQILSLGPEHVFISGSKLLVRSPSRVLVWNTFPATADQAPSFVLGDPNASTITNRPVSASAMSSRGRIWTDGTRLVVSDTHYHRVLVWSTFPTANDQPASFALGQPAGAANLTSSTENNGGRSGATLSSPTGVYCDGTRLFVADMGNHRVLVWNTFPTSGGESADYALGQPAGATNLTDDAWSGGVTGATMTFPYGVSGDGTRLYVSDSGANRVLVWSTTPTTGGQPASFALGQPAGPTNLETYAQNAGGVSGSSMAAPEDVTTDGTRLAVADRQNGRILVWSTLPTTGGQAASYALGQPAGAGNLTTNTQNNGGVSGSSLYSPSSVSIAGGKLVIADTLNFRVLVWNTLPAAGGASASFAIGKPVGATNLTAAASASLATNATTYAPSGRMATDGKRLFVADETHHRVLVWDTMPTSSQEPASFALGQPAGPNNLTSDAPNNGGVSGTSMRSPQGAYIIGTRLYVVDSGNNRVLVWNTIPTNASTPASFALGQPAGAANLTSSASGTSATTMSFPTDIVSDGTRLFVADYSNNRVLVWSTLPSAGGEAASFALGQAAGPDNLTTNVNGSSGVLLKGPAGIEVAGTRLFVADTSNHRVLVWNTIPTAGGEPASYALGQPAGAANLTSGVQNNGGISASSMSFPSKIASDGTQLFVADAVNARVLVWSAIPTSGGEAATSVIGQTDFTGGMLNAGGAVSSNTLGQPAGFLIERWRLFVADGTNSRILVVPR